ncbi:SAM-dependent methyltransferase [Serinicoccus sp. CUA-874]|uniref:SAM-dependent methyltransferase n=1 Tax=Serinicoccus sp. CUA-874 TaxID=1517939 RepID=UPI00117A7D76|nr:SAM-dependent methyltransferase [Serinicoccus sp. CUA-874]
MSRPVPADWLALRRAADHRARERAAGLLRRLGDHVGERTGQELVVLDIGAGTGSNQAWLAPRSRGPALGPGRPRPRPPRAGGRCRARRRRDDPARVATVEEVHSLVPSGGEVLVTCAALLDLLTVAELDALADVVAPMDRPGVAALLSLTVTGDVEISPPHPADAAVTAAFDAHQRREDRPGPEATEAMAAALRRRGADVELAATDWELNASDESLVRRYLQDRAAVAVEQDATLAPLAREWLAAREGSLMDGSLRVRVGHLDLLSLPVEPGSGSGG